MKVAVVSHCSIPFEYHKRIRALSEHADVTLIVPKRWRDTLGVQRFVRRLEEQDVKIIALDIVFDGHVGGYFMPGLGRALKTISPDLVHADDEPYSVCAAHVAYLKKRLKIPRFTLHCSDNMEIDLRRINREFQRRLLPSVDGIFTLSSEGAHFYRERGYRGPIQVAPLVGVDPDLFRPLDKETARTQLGIASEAFVVGFMGRLVPEKGVALLVKAFAALRTPRKSKLVLVGRGPELENLRKLAVEFGVERDVVMYDSVPLDEVPVWMSAFDALVLSSLTLQRRWKEQYGRVIVEAMACGTPVIGSDSGAIPEVIGNAGIVVQEGDIGGIRDVLMWLCEDEGLRLRMAEAGRSRALDLFTHRQVARTMVSFWRHVLADRGAPASAAVAAGAPLSGSSPSARPDTGELPFWGAGYAVAELEEAERARAKTLAKGAKGGRSGAKGTPRKSKASGSAQSGKREKQKKN